MKVNAPSFCLIALMYLLVACDSKKGSPFTEVSNDLLLPESALPTYEQNIDHAGILANLDDKAMARGKKIYGTTCFNCHGDMDQPGSLPTAKFWADTLKYSNEPYGMYQTISRGFGLMPPQIQLVPQQKYDVIHYIRETYFKTNNAAQYLDLSPNYLAGLPLGDSVGPAPKDWQPWSEMDYGDFLINTYEIVEEEEDPRPINRRGSPIPNEDYSQANFAQKGIAIRLDEGEGGVAAGKAWLVFDHDLMRIAGAWTGEGFIDWKAILLNGQHNTYPRNIGELHFENPIGPGWANPKTGAFDDPRFQGLDGRPFGPLPRE